MPFVQRLSAALLAGGRHGDLSASGGALSPLTAVPAGSLSAAAARALLAAAAPFVLLDAATAAHGFRDWLQPLPTTAAPAAPPSALGSSAALAALSPPPTVPVTSEPPFPPQPARDANAAEAYAAAHASTRLPVLEALAAIDANVPDVAFESARRLYVKDWHAVVDTLGTAPYAVPPLFADDWLNWWCDIRTVAGAAPADFRFVYAGQAGSWTPLHHDVLYSASWSANVRGWKLWLLIPPTPGNLAALHDRWGALRFCSVLLADEVAALEAAVVATAAAGEALPVCDAPVEVDALAYAERACARAALSGCRFALQPPASVLYVPAGWRHEVHNLSQPTLSVNHNFFSGAIGLRDAWEFLARGVAAARVSLADCRTRPLAAVAAAEIGSAAAAATPVDWAWEALVQRLVKTDAGLCYDDVRILPFCCWSHCARLRVRARAPLSAVLPVFLPPHCSSSLSC